MYGVDLIDYMLDVVNVMSKRLIFSSFLFYVIQNAGYDESKMKNVDYLSVFVLKGNPLFAVWMKFCGEWAFL